MAFMTLYKLFSFKKLYTYFLMLDENKVAR